MTEMELGRLERVHLREIWRSESGSFSVWLAENLPLLTEALGLDELVLEQTEAAVGPYRIDILCKETTTDRFVVIENQLEKTDHDHLGKLLTYTAGVKANIVIWIAARFTEEHRAAIDWLNTVSDEDYAFFGVEIEAWRIGSSSAAPKFNVVAKPNDWSRQMASTARHAGQLTDTKRTQLEFWTGFRAWAEEHARLIRPTKPHPQHWMNLAIGRSGFRLAAIASAWDSSENTYAGHELRAELQIYASEAKEYFRLLEQDQQAIETELGEPLTWHDSPTGRSCRLYLRKEFDLEDRDHWDEDHAWLTTRLDKMHEVFAGRVRALRVE